jgi:antirestriction protein ArdC
MTTTPAKVTVADILADKFILALENGTIPWQKPWKSVSVQNAVSRKAYSGVNAFILGMFGSDNYYLTFNQIKAMGGTLEKGTRSMPVQFFSKIEASKSKNNQEFLLRRYYNVFPMNKVTLADGKVFKRMDKVISFTPVAEAERLSSLSTTPVKHGGTQAYFAPSEHRIQMPQKDSFKSVAHYYATLFHEIGHSLKEKGTHSKGFGSEPYAKEELVAELFSSLCLAECGLEAPEVTTNTTAYLQNWLTALKGDKTLILSASAEAFKRFTALTKVAEVAEVAEEVEA